MIAEVVVLCCFFQVWEIEESKHQPGMVEHTIGWPLVSIFPQLSVHLIMSLVITSINGCIVLSLVKVMETNFMGLLH